MTTTIVSSGLTSAGLTVGSGNSEVVLGGGVADDTAVLAGGDEYVSSGGLTSGTALADFATLPSGRIETASEYLSGGTAVGTIVGNDAALFVWDGGTAVSAVLDNGGNEYVGGGTAVGTVVSSGGFEYLDDGAVIGGTVLSGGVARLEDDGYPVYDPATSSYATDFPAATISGVIVDSGGELLVNGGVAIATVLSGGVEHLGSENYAFRGAGTSSYVAGVIHGVASGTQVQAGGTEFVGGDGFAYGPTANDGGALVLSGGTSFGAVIGSGGSGIVGSGTIGGYDSRGEATVATTPGVTSDTRVLAGGAETVLSGSLADNTVLSGGALTVSPGGTADDVTISGGALDLRAGARAEGNIVFGGRGTLDIGDTATPDAVLSGFAAGDAIELETLAYAAGGSATLDPGTDVLTVTEGGLTRTLRLFGTYTSEYFRVAAGEGGGTLVTVDAAACYARGTLIRTPAGEVPIEALAIGDAVLTASGLARRIRWIGCRAYAAPFARRNPDVWPVTIAPGALADGVPGRALRVSPNHALLLAGVLVEARLLVNGTTITCTPPGGGVDYLNIELDSHDAVLAEGAPAETFLACDGRGRFGNAAEYAALYPDEAPACEPLFCARRTDDGPALAALRQQLSGRAGGARRTVDGRLVGAVDRADARGVSGWVRDLDAPDAAVELEAVLDGAVVARAVANRQRWGLGACAYELRWPAPLDGRRHVVELRRATDGASLPGAPVLTGTAPGLDAVVAALAGLHVGGAAALDGAAAFLLGQVDALMAAEADDAREARRTRFHVSPDVQPARTAA